MATKDKSNPLENAHGFYKGIVIQNNDPYRRGRVKIFIHELAPMIVSLLKLDTNDLFTKSIGENTNNFLKGNSLILLKEHLPWAEQSSPLIGSGCTGTYDAVNGKATSGDGYDGKNPEGSYAPRGYYGKAATAGAHQEGHKTGVADVFNNSYAPDAFTNSAKGMFSIPKVGAHVWVFFEGGNMSKPIYFGYSYDQNDWLTLYNPQSDNPDVDYPNRSENVKGDDEYHLSGKTIFNSKAGSLVFRDKDDFESIQLTHFSGSHIAITNHVTVDVNTENKSTIVHEDYFTSVNGDYVIEVGGDIHTTYKGTSYTNFGDMTNQVLYKKWKQIVEKSMLARSEVTRANEVKNPTKPANDKGAPAAGKSGQASILTHTGNPTETINKLEGGTTDTFKKLDVLSKLGQYAADAKDYFAGKLKGILNFSITIPETPKAPTVPVTLPPVPVLPPPTP